jgi:hypothetical protein
MTHSGEAAGSGSATVTSSAAPDLPSREHVDERRRLVEHAPARRVE